MIESRMRQNRLVPLAFAVAVFLLVELWKFVMRRFEPAAP